MLHGIVEADESYIGGKPLNRYPHMNRSNSPRGRGTSKLAVLGVVQRGGKVVARVAEDLSGEGIVKFIKEAVNPEGSHLITDSFKSYWSVRPFMRHSVFTRSQGVFKRGIHTNTMEGFWASFKRAWYGTHHRYCKKYAPLYIAECCYKYNSRRNPNAFETFLEGCFKVAA